jgi:hypothetical protein
MSQASRHQGAEPCGGTIATPLDRPAVFRRSRLAITYSQRMRESKTFSLWALMFLLLKS